MAVIEELRGAQFTAGYNVNVKSMRLTIDPGITRLRPFFVYVAIAAARAVVGLGLWYIGFERRTIGLLSYYVWQPAKRAEGAIPVVFVHGIGVGVLPYVALIARIRRVMLDAPMCGAIFLPEMPYVSMTFTDKHTPTPTEIVRDMDDMLRIHGYSRAIFGGHSLGTSTHDFLFGYRSPAAQPTSRS